MNNTHFKTFCRDIALGLITIITLLFLCNVSGIFDFEESSSRPEQMWSNLVQKNSVNTAQIIFCGNSQTYYLNPLILDSITKKSSHCFGYPKAIIKPLSWFLFNSLDYLNPELLILETHSFYESFDSSSIDSIRYARWENEYPRFNTFPINFTYIPWSKNKLPSFSSLFDINKFKLSYLVTGPVIKNHHLFETHPDYFVRVLFPSKSDNLQGFRQSHHSPISNSLLRNYNNDWMPRQEMPIKTKELQIVESIIKFCKAKGIKVIIYESPMYFKHIKPDKLRQKQLNSFCQRLNTPFINLNLNPSLTRTPAYFQSTRGINQHLTPDGANAVSQALALAIVEQTSPLKAKTINENYKKLEIDIASIKSHIIN
jgi:hypothetical protein